MIADQDISAQALKKTRAAINNDSSLCDHQVSTHLKGYGSFLGPVLLMNTKSWPLWLAFR